MSILGAVAQNLRISTKIAISSGIALVLVGAIVISQMLSDARVQNLKDDVDREQAIVADIIDAKASVRGMQIAVRDIRLASTPERMRAASDYLEARKRSVNRFIDQANTNFRVSGQSTEVTDKLRSLADQYEAGAKQMVTIRNEAVALRTKGEASDRAAALDSQAASVASERTLPLAAEMEKISAAAVDAARARAKDLNESLAQTMLSARTINLTLAGFAAILLIGTAAFMVMTVTRPLRSLTVGMNELAAGNFDVELSGVARKDEIGGIAKAVDTFKLKLEEKMRLEAEKEQEIARKEQAAREERARKEAEATRQIAQVVEGLGAGLERLAKGDLTCRVNDEWAAEYRKIQEDFNGAIEQLRHMIHDIASSTSEVSNAAAEISTATTDLSQRTEEQASSLEETSASMEEIAATVKQNAENARQARELTRNTSEVADRGGKVVAQAVEAMVRIEESSRRISDIISVIDEIARQTNLLALNAAVEAARAGEAGRGFAVVASEVRGLAQRSSQAAKDIKDLIVSSSAQVQDGVDLVNRAGDSLKDIVGSIKAVANMVSDIANASSEQSAGLEQINKALSQMDEVTQQNSAMVEENAASARLLEQQADGMQKRLSAFRLEAGATARVVPALTAQARPAAAKPIALRRGPARQMQASLATAVAHDQWQEF